jgi:hypothetical protein
VIERVAEHTSWQRSGAVTRNKFRQGAEKDMDVKHPVMICLSAAVWGLTTGVAWSDTLRERGTY